MTFKRFTLVFMLLALLTASVSADDAPARKGFAVMGHWHSGPDALLYDPLVHEATGLESEALRAALLEGKTLGALVEANDGDVETVIAALVAQASEAMNSQAESKLEGLEEAFAEAMNEAYRRRFPWRRRPNPIRENFGAWGMNDTITEATGLDVNELNMALLEGSTMAELIEANEGDVKAVVSSLVEQATEGINEAAITRIQRYEETVGEIFEADFADTSRRWRKWRPRHGAFFGFWGVYEHNQPAASETDDT